MSYADDIKIWSSKRNTEHIINQYLYKFLGHVCARDKHQKFYQLPDMDVRRLHDKKARFHFYRVKSCDISRKEHFKDVSFKVRLT